MISSDSNKCLKSSALKHLGSASFHCRAHYAGAKREILPDDGQTDYSTNCTNLVGKATSIRCTNQPSLNEQLMHTDTKRINLQCSSEQQNQRDTTSTVNCTCKRCVQVVSRGVSVNTGRIFGKATSFRCVSQPSPYYGYRNCRIPVVMEVLPSHFKIPASFCNEESRMSKDIHLFDRERKMKPGEERFGMSEDTSLQDKQRETKLSNDGFEMFENISYLDKQRETKPSSNNSIVSEDRCLVVKQGETKHSNDSFIMSEDRGLLNKQRETKPSSHYIMSENRCLLNKKRKAKSNNSGSGMSADRRLSGKQRQTKHSSENSIISEDRSPLDKQEMKHYSERFGLSENTDLVRKQQKTKTEKEGNEMSGDLNLLNKQIEIKFYNNGSTLSNDKILLSKESETKLENKCSMIPVDISLLNKRQAEPGHEKPGKTQDKILLDKQLKTKFGNDGSEKIEDYIFLNKQSETKYGNEGSMISGKSEDRNIQDRQQDLNNKNEKGSGMFQDTDLLDLQRQTNLDNEEFCEERKNKLDTCNIKQTEDISETYRQRAKPTDVCEVKYNISVIFADKDREKTDSADIFGSDNLEVISDISNICEENADLLDVNEGKTNLVDVSVKSAEILGINEEKINMSAKSEEMYLETDESIFSGSLGEIYFSPLDSHFPKTSDDTCSFMASSTPTIPSPFSFQHMYKLARSLSESIGSIHPNKPPDFDKIPFNDNQNVSLYTRESDKSTPLKIRLWKRKQERRKAFHESLVSFSRHNTFASLPSNTPAKSKSAFENPMHKSKIIRSKGTINDKAWNKIFPRDTPKKIPIRDKAAFNLPIDQTTDQPIHLNGEVFKLNEWTHTTDVLAIAPKDSSLNREASASNVLQSEKDVSPLYLPFCSLSFDLGSLSFQWDSFF